MALTNLGTCPNCHQTNSYSAANCIDCGARLPWADAIQQASATAAPPAVAPGNVATATVPPATVPPATMPSASSGSWQNSAAASISIPTANFEPASVGLLISVLVFCIGYFTPWVNVSLFLVSMGVGGGMGTELLALLASLAVVVLALQPYLLKVHDAFPVHRYGLSAACLAFAFGELLYWGLVSPMVQLGVGTFLMAGGAAGMSFFTLKQLPRPLIGKAAGFGAAAVILVMLGAGLRAQQQRAALYAGLSNLFTGSSNPMTAPALPAFPETRSDVAVKLNSNYTTTTLAAQMGTEGTYTADTGKEYLVCNVTLSFTGNSGSLNVGNHSFKLEGSNKQVYQGRMFLGQLTTVKLISATLLPGGTVTGDVVFEVDTGVQAVNVSYTAF